MAAATGIGRQEGVARVNPMLRFAMIAVDADDGYYAVQCDGENTARCIGYAEGYNAESAMQAFENRDTELPPHAARPGPVPTASERNRT